MCLLCYLTATHLHAILLQHITEIAWPLCTYNYPLPTTDRYLLLPATYHYPLPTTDRYLLLTAAYYYPLPTTTRYLLLPATYY